VGEGTKIEWAHDTFNPWWGCTRVAPECERCYAESFAKRTGHGIWGTQAPRRFFADKHWNEPLKWNREAEASGEPRRVFCASMADVFEDRRDLDEHRFRLWKLIEATPALTWLLLTKRPENHEMVPLAWQTGTRRPANVWLGTTCGSDRWTSTRRVDVLRSAMWPRRIFVSAEPLLALPTFDLQPDARANLRQVDRLIVGAESGPKARPMNEDHVRALRDRALEARTAFFYKQKVIGSLKLGIPELDGRRWAEVPGEGDRHG
jgi:protein gp37